GYYFDFLTMLKYYEERKQTPATPAISLLYALDVQLDRMAEEGMENRFRRHREMAEMAREWGRKHFELFAEPGYESLTVTTIRNTRGISVAELNAKLAKRGFVISNGYGKLKEKTFRIGHMGDLTKEDLSELLKNIDEILELER
ncbi:MAG: alanine--glyoxylate aminotransferase family protein, partial [Candidatus Hydrothermae bacterium]|nr:alanine--glyoxylate aminotransferase family protein [Candidatus Hydrothermae bacterium]